VAAADEVALLERLISYDTSRDEGIQEAFAFLKGWLEARSIAHVQYDRGLPSLVAAVGDGPRTVVWNAHVDVVPGRAEQFSPWRVNGRVYGRGAYDMKGGLAGMLAALADLADARDTIPGVKVKTSPNDPFPISQVKLVQYNNGLWNEIGNLIDGRGT